MQTDSPDSGLEVNRDAMLSFRRLYSALSMYFLFIVPIFLLWFSLCQLARLQCLPSFMSGTLLLLTLIYIQELFLGVIGRLGNLSSGISLVGLSAVALLLFTAGQHRAPAETAAFPLEDDLTTTRLSILEVISALCVFIILTRYFLVIIAPGVFSKFLPWIPMGWDAVSYHLPALLDFYRTKGLWSTQAAYSTYSFGWELVSGFFSKAYFLPWGFPMIHLLTIGCFVCVVWELSKYYLQLIGVKRSVLTLPLTVGLAFLGIIIVDPIPLVDVWKNDLFMTTFVLSSFYYLLLAFSPAKRSRMKPISALLLSSLFLGMSVATKPNALIYLPPIMIVVFLGGLGTLSGPMAARHNARNALAVVTAYCLLPALVGGFWYAKNLYIYGTINPLVTTRESVILFNLFNPGLFDIPSFWRILVPSAVPVVVLCLVVFQAKNELQRLRFATVAACLFLVVGLLGFLVTPNGLFPPHSIPSANSILQFRLAYPFFVGLMILLAVSWSMVVEHIGKNSYVGRNFSLSYSILNPWSSNFSSSFVLALMLIWCCFLIVVPLFWGRYQSTGLPGYERLIPGKQATTIYSWVRERGNHLRIYSIGLRPYGLAGKEWSNNVFHELHSEEQTPERVKSVLDRFNPSLIILSIDPHGDKVKSWPLILDYFENNPKCFSPVFADSQVKAFNYIRNSSCESGTGVVNVGVLRSSG